MISKVVKNNLIVLHNNDDIFMIEISFPCGAVNESEANHGISHFLEHMKFRKMKNKNMKDANNKIALLGGIVNAYTTKDQTGYYIKCNITAMSDAIDTIISLVFNTDFSKNKIDIERKVILEELKIKKGSEIYYNDILSSVLKEDNLYLNTIGGDDKTILTLTNEDLKHYNNYFYCLKKAKFVLNCPKSKTKLMYEKLNKSLSTYKVASVTDIKGKLYNTQLDVCDYKRFDPSIIVTPVHATTNTVIITFCHVGRTNIDHLLVNFIIYILTGSYKCLLNKYVRQDNGFTYGVNSVKHSFLHFGLLSITFNTSKDEISDIIYEILAIIKKQIIFGKMKETVFSKFKKDYINSLRFHMKDNNNVMDFYTGLSNLPIQYDLDKFVSRVEKISLDEFCEVCSEVFRFDKMGCNILSKKLSQDAHVDAFQSVLLKIKGLHTRV